MSWRCSHGRALTPGARLGRETALVAENRIMHAMLHPGALDQWQGVSNFGNLKSGTTSMSATMEGSEGELRGEESGSHEGRRQKRGNGRDGAN
jgi:hypothetical protein